VPTILRGLVAYVNSYQMIWREPVQPKYRCSPSRSCSSSARTITSLSGRDFAARGLRGKMGHNVERARELVRRCRKANVEMFEGVGHLIHLEAPEKFNDAVIRFLNDGRKLGPEETS
jgi:pimeloyl-ACP methyl ester carboxylesterase